MKIVSVIYHETEMHYKLALKAWSNMPVIADKISVINKKFNAPYPEDMILIENSENCLAKAWNIGLKKAFESEDYAFVSGLDLICPQEDQLDDMINILKKNPNFGMVAATPLNAGFGEQPMQHGDGSFSFYCISKKCFEDVGDFDEQYKPAYFEDNDYLERLWLKGYQPKRLPIYYYHIGQGTVKHGSEIQKQYPGFMQKNLEIFKNTYGKVPDHLPKDVKFK